MSDADDWHELFKATTMADVPQEFKDKAGVKPLWPNDWHQDCAAVAYQIVALRTENEKLRKEWAAMRNEVLTLRQK